METKQATYVTMAATERVCFYNWKGKTRANFDETKNCQIEISDIDTDELLRAISYFVRSIAGDSDRTETQTRILNDIAKTLTDTLKAGEITA
jgi:hypothetical protein